MESPAFEIVGHLGAGGMAEVHSARMTLDGATVMVALKRIRADLAAKADIQAQFEREAKIGSLLVHEHIVALHAFGKDAQGPYLAFELIDGPALSSFLEAIETRAESLAAAVCLRIACDVAEALVYAHRHGAIHRDITPDNILLSSQGVTKLGDFGIAKLTGATRFTHTGTVKGKFGFIAPELFDGAEADARSDYFSLGATLFRLFTGVDAFPGRTDAEVIRGVLHGTTPSLSALRPRLAAGISGWVDRALAKDPRSRPTSMDDLLSALHAQLEVHPDARAQLAVCVRACAPQVLEKARATVALRPSATPVPRRRLMPWLTGGLGAMALVAVGYSAWPDERPASRVATPTTERPAPALAPERTPSPMVKLESPVAPAPAAVATRALEGTVQPRPKAMRQKAKPVAVITDRPAVTAAAEAKPTAPTSPETGEPGILWIKVSPWALVYVDGQSRGATPMPPFSVSPGKHSVVLVNEALKVRKVLDVVVKPGQQLEVKEKL